MQKIVFNLINVIVSRGAGRVPLASVETASLLMVKKIQTMPIWLNAPIVILTFIFDIWGLLLTGRLFQHQDLEQQSKTIQSWQNAPLKVFGKFIQFYEKLGLFIYYSL